MTRIDHTLFNEALEGGFNVPVFLLGNESTTWIIAYVVYCIVFRGCSRRVVQSRATMDRRENGVVAGLVVGCPASTVIILARTR